MHAPAPDISDEAIARQFTRIFMHGIRESSEKEYQISEIQRPVKQV